VRAEWEPDELIDAWTLTGSDWDLIANKTGVTRLGFTVMLKFYEIEGRFPAYREEVPQAAVTYLGSLVKVEPALFARYSWRGRTIEYHRAQIRRAYGTRPPTPRQGGRAGGPTALWAVRRAFVRAKSWLLPLDAGEMQDLGFVKRRSTMSNTFRVGSPSRRRR